MMKVNQFLKAIGAALLIGIFMATTSGCQKQEGPVERAGKQVDKAVEKVGENVEKAGDNIQDAAKGNKK